MSKNSEYLKGLRAKARAAGKCGTCRKRPARPNRSGCAWCALKTKMSRLANRAEGKCRCGGEPRRGKRTCVKCFLSTREYYDFRYQIAVLEGRCAYMGGCDLVASPNRRLCDRHRARAAAYARKYYHRKKGEP